MRSEPGNGELMYRRLQVAPEATAQQIRQAYRRLAHDVHPDANPEDPQASRRFQEITEAYEILSSPERRALYDHARRPPAHSIQTQASVWSSPAMFGVAGGIGAGPPTVIGAVPHPVGSAPLAAGPTHVTQPGEGADAMSVGARGDLIRLIEAIWSRWETW